MLHDKGRWFIFWSLLALLLLPLAPVQRASAQDISHTFPETGKTVRGLFLRYWQLNGGLAQQGYPISDEMGEISPTDGKTYTVQYFERTVMEYHPYNLAPNDVLLSLLGAFTYGAKYPNGAPGQVPNTAAGSVRFPETGRRVSSTFYAYWQTHGGLAQQGYPISDEFVETSALNGKQYLVQYFERAVFEFHPENPQATSILLSQLGTLRYHGKYPPGSALLPPPYLLPTGLYSPDGTYSGQMIDGVREGQGTFTWNNGDVYTGQWHNDLMNGQGVYTLKGVGQYSGSFVDDKYSGEGTMTRRNGDKFVGSWVNSQMEGFGTYTSATGESYTGDWVGGKMQGRGTYRFPNGTVMTGRWYNNQYVGAK